MSLLTIISDLLVHGASETSSWAMMMAGFGGAGALARRVSHRRIYRLVETLPGGETQSELFTAPDDATAVRRAEAIAEGRIELWRGPTRITC